ncbi:DEAD/DEAH box helicase domain protein [Hymenobacter roseosalivarius DSM 11622]|uniref:DEAD/DEAH box helicase domain protein n=1 Tax=Hymenobacter roseosalivarius DSM 11622 TaxID=645990 RepID=A0A1W1V1V5_9BACT|nr:DEAD/DEAH box helicase [Hymenobacter roseosalivarius]SMB87305.1 DEAD/DEAH box helicase domain protein [Hymenobacter roseosalivarius DSM 11622]
MSDVTPQPTTFADFKLNKQLLTAVAEAGFTEPTPVQQQTIPLLLAGHDVLGIAQTGTGKTAAFGLPLLMKVKYAQGIHPRALILAPTRELAIQLETHLKRLATQTDLRIYAIYGGLGPKTQIETLAQGVDILIATPGRLLELYLKGDLVLKELKTLVLDEADKMMDMGFMPQIRRILEVIPNKRQNVLFSATMPDKVATLSEEFLEFPVRVEVTPSATSAQNVSQTMYQVPNLLTKINLLGHLVRDEEVFNRVMIFCRTKEHADNVAHFLGRKSTGEVRAIHGNKGQNVRINAMEAFRNGELRFLVATDVAARGIDVPQVSHVINFDVPLIYDDYVHRIGRTGRAQHTGAAITFANAAEMHHMGRIAELINQTIPELPLPSDVTVAATAFDEQQGMDREIDERRRRLDPNYQGAFHEKKVPLQKDIDKRTGLPYVEGPNRSVKGRKANPSKGRSSSPAKKAIAKARNRRK